MNEETQKIKKFTDLKAWQESRMLVKNVYRLTYLFPKEELYGMTNQVRRSCVSVTSNIAEGFKRDTMKDKIHFYVMAHGSLTEVQNQLILSSDLQYIEGSHFEDIMHLTERVDKLLSGLIRASKERL